MPTITSAGVGSGLDINGLVTSLVNAETVPVTKRLNTKEAAIQTEISAIGQLKGGLAQFQSSLSGLKSLSSFDQRSTSNTSPDLFKVAATNDAGASNFTVKVLNLASAQSLTSQSFASLDSIVGIGTLNFHFGTYHSDSNSFTQNPNHASTSIDITSANNTLAGIQNAINQADLGVTATIVNDGTGYRLIFTSEQTGADNSLQILTTGDADSNNTDTQGLSRLSYDPTLGVNSGENLTETIAAENAEISLNGLLITSESNTFTNVLEGVTITATKADQNTTASVSVSMNRSAIVTKVSSFVGDLNTLLNGLNQLTAFNPETKESGPLQGDAGIRTLKIQIRNLISNPVAGLTGEIRSMVDIGIKTNDQGNLTLDMAKLNSAIDNHFEEIGRLFAFGGFATDPKISVNDFSSAVPTGTYPISITHYSTTTHSLSGSIGGHSAVSNDGETLEASGLLEGVSLEITGGTTGNRGELIVFSGIASQLDDLLGQYLGSNGTLQNRSHTLNDKLRDISDQREELDYRAERIRSRYLHQFIALDSLLAELGQTSAFLTQQLSRLPSNKNN